MTSEQMWTAGGTGLSGAAATYYAIRDRAGDRCECTGECGQAHQKGAGRCHVENTWPDPRHVLTVVPANPTLPLSAATVLPREQLRLWCEGCTARVRRSYETAALAADDGELMLWSTA